MPFTAGEGAADLFELLSLVQKAAKVFAAAEAQPNFQQKADQVAASGILQDLGAFIDKIKADVKS